MVSLGLVFWYALLTDLTTGLGALPFAFFKHISKVWLGTFNAIAAGFMGSASVLLIVEGANFSWERTVAGILLGVLMVIGLDILLHRVPHPEFAEITKADFRKMFLIVAIMTIHSIGEGIGIGVSFGGGEAFGLLIALSMAVHNIPEGLAISLVLIPRGASVFQAAGWSIFSSLPQPIMAVLAYLFVQYFESYLPVGLGLAAGAMLWMVVRELLPESLESAPLKVVAPAGLGAAVVMYFLVLALGGW